MATNSTEKILLEGGNQNQLLKLEVNSDNEINNNPYLVVDKAEIEARLGGITSHEVRHDKTAAG